MADLLQVLYEKYETLSSAAINNKISEHSAEYLECISGTKGGPKEKRLTAQIISTFYKHFPTLQEQALNALLDLCEETDSEIRIYAMKALPQLCKDNKENVMNIASVLSQLLQLEDQEYNIARHSLLQVFKEDRLNAVKGIFSNLSSADEGLRDKIVNFVYKKLATSGSNKEVAGFEDLLISEGKKILLDSSAEEFLTVMPYLLDSKLGKTTTGQLELVNLVAERIEINEKFDPLEEGTHNTDRLIMCIDSILPLFSVTVDSSKFLAYYCKEVLSQWDVIGTLKDGYQYQLKLLVQLAQLSVHCAEAENITEIVEKIFSKLKDYMPLPPENVDLSNIPNLDFTAVECLLYAFHKLARKCPEFLTSDEDRLKDFRSRLQYFARGVQGCKRGLQNTLEGKNEKVDELNEKDKNKLTVAPVLFENINALIKDLFHHPTPLYKCVVKLSCKHEKAKVKQSIAANPDTSPRAQRRHAPITFDSSNGTSPPKRPKSNKSGEDRQLYQPPSGKFSSSFGRSSSRGGGGGGWSRGGGSRGRGSRGGSRNWRN